MENGFEFNRKTSTEMRWDGWEGTDAIDRWNGNTWMGWTE